MQMRPIGYVLIHLKDNIGSENYVTVEPYHNNKEEGIATELFKFPGNTCRIKFGSKHLTVFHWLREGTEML